ncbi:pimeloyl-ACP methyl ester carboxylesterase [Microbacterium sp. SLBN-154]|uniref:alpha/beta hydrolase n=1 Tax=Microbacterium sp. SLBN-154 TaxID=2768458 RepID=UPI001151A8A3|nr:alpha/beta hydrolase [Microbacterium sp. SLBN-154]TQK19844.1 pimeloyl-ACP methyl ester carboxylesterase [Microbacterium sp. SLBN-154]
MSGHRFHRYRTRDIPVPGGALRVGVWEPTGPVRGEILAVHGVTSSHRVWAHTVERLPGIRVIAPDLRGRGRSTANRPAGMARHADDLALVLAETSGRASVVVGHSMGGFVSVVLAHRHPDLLDRLLLVDGGLPLRAPEGLSPEETVAAILGPTAARLRMRFDDEADYLRFWRAHPAFPPPWTPELEDYFRYDLLDADNGALRPATSEAVTIEDTVDLTTGSALRVAVDALGHPTRLLTVPRGLRDEEPGLYPPDHLSALLRERPAISHRRVAGFNHYSILLTPEGGAVVADEVVGALQAP